MVRINRFLAIIALFLFVVILGSCGGGGGGSGSGGSGGEPAENFTLTVDKFGEGVITSDIPGINCDNDCSESYQEGTTVVLTATEQSSDNYTFYSWAGCDSITDNTCTVYMNRDKIVLPTFQRELIIKATTKILNEDTLQYLINQEDSIFYFDSQATEILDLIPGDIIAGGTGKGFLRKVTSVYILSNGQIAVETTDTTIEEAIIEGGMAFSKKLTQSDLTSQRLKKGVSLRQASNDDSTEFTFDFNEISYSGVSSNIEKSDAFDVGETISGSVTIELEPDFALDSRACFRLIPVCIDEFKSVVITTNVNQIDLTVKGGASGDIIEPIKIGTLAFGPFPVGGGVIWLTPEINIYVGVDGYAEATLNTGVTMTNVLTTGVHYTDSAGWKGVWGFSTDFDYSPLNFLGSASIRAYVRPEGIIWISSVLGPYFNMDEYLRQEVQASTYELWWGLYTGLDASAGVKVKILGVSLGDYNVDLVNPNLEWLKAEDTVTIGNTPPTATITNPSYGSTYTQGESITFSGSGSDPEDGTLSGSSLVWTSNIDGQIGTGTSFPKSDLSVGTHTITLTATDSEGETGSASLNITITETATPLSITTTFLSSGTVGVSYPATNLSATGGKTPYSWSILSGSLPPGLSMSTGGIISGTFTIAGTYNFTVQVMDSSSPQQTTSTALSIVVLFFELNRPYFSD